MKYIKNKDKGNSDINVTVFTDLADGKTRSTRENFLEREGWFPFGDQGFFEKIRPDKAATRELRDPTGRPYSREKYEKYYAAGDHNLGPQPSLQSGTRDTSSIANIWAGKEDPYTSHLTGGVGPDIRTTSDALEGLFGPARSEVVRAQFLNSTRQNAGAMFGANSLFKQYPNAAVGQWTRNTPMGDAYGGHKKPLAPTGFTYKEEKQYGMLTDSNWWGKKHYDKQLKDARTFSVGGSDKGFLGQLEAGGGIPGIVAGGLNKIGGGLSSSLAVIKDIITKPPIPGSALSMLASASKGGEGFRVDSGGSLYRTAGQTTSTGSTIYTPAHTVSGSNKGQGYSKPEGGFAGRFNPVGAGGGFVYPGQQGGRGPGGGKGAGGSSVAGAEAGGLSGFMGAGGNTMLGQVRHMALWNALMIPLGVGAAVGRKALGYGDAVSKPQFALTGVNFTESMRKQSKDWAIQQQLPYTSAQELLKGIKETSSAWGRDVGPGDLPGVLRATRRNQMASQYTMEDVAHTARFTGRFMNILRKSKQYKDWPQDKLHKYVTDHTANIMALGTAHGAEVYQAAKVALPQMINKGMDFGSAMAEISTSVETIGGGMTGTALSKLTTGQGGAHTSMAKSDIFHDRLTENYIKYKGSPRAVTETLKERNDKYFKKGQGARELEARERAIVRDLKDERKKTARFINLANQLNDYDEMGIGSFSKKLNMQRVMPYLSNFTGQTVDDIVEETAPRKKKVDMDKEDRQQNIDMNPGSRKNRYDKSWELVWDHLRENVSGPFWGFMQQNINEAGVTNNLTRAAGANAYKSMEEVIARANDIHTNTGEMWHKKGYADVLKAKRENYVSQAWKQGGFLSYLGAEANMTMNNSFGQEAGFNWLGGGYQAKIGERLGIYPKGTTDKWREERNERQRFMPNLPEEDTEQSKRLGYPSKKGIAEFQEKLKTGEIPTEALNVTLQITMDQAGNILAQNASAQKPPTPGSPANAPVGATQSSSPTGTFTWPSLTNPIGGK